MKLKLLAVLAVAAAPAFAQNAAVVNNKPIPSARVDAVMKQLKAQGQPDNEDTRKRVREELIMREVLMQEAEKQGIDKRADVKAEIADARATLTVRAMVGDIIGKAKIDDKDVQAEYDAFKKQAGDKEFHVRHIVADSEAGAKDVIAKLKAGAKFEDLAKDSKDAGTAANGGDLDWAAPAAFPPVFAEALSKLGKGQVTETPVKTDAGWHVIKVDDIRATKLPALDEVKPQIVQELQGRKFQAFQEELKKKASIK